MPSFQSPAPMSGRPCAPYFIASLDGADAVLEERRRLRRDRRQRRSVSSGPASSGGASRNGTTSSSTDWSPVCATYAATAYGSHSRSSEQRVRVPRPARRMPPVLDVAFDELPRRGQQQMRAAEIRPRVEQRQHVLQLIAEAERAARLVRAAPRPDAAAERLIQQPAIHDQVERVVRRAGPGSRRACRPRTRAARRATSSTSLEPRRSAAARSTACAAVASLAQHERDASRLARRDLDGDLQRSARVEARRRFVRSGCRGTAPPGGAAVRLRPMNSARSQVNDCAGSVARKNATRSANSVL